jgi:hypothetical protein
MWSPNAPALFSIAVDSAKRITTPLRVGGQRDALVSVVFAAASLEAFLNEAAYLADKSVSRKVRETKLGHLVEEEPPIVSAFAQVMDEAEESKVQVQSKFQLAHLILTNKIYDKASVPFQDFLTLIAVRNLLMHGKSKETFLTVEGKPSVLNPVSIIKKLASKNILHELLPGEKGYIAVVGDTGVVDLILLEEIGEIPLKSSESGVMARWSFVIGTKAVAEWACSSAAQMAIDLMEKAPVSLWKQFMDSQFRETFSAPL